MTRIALDDGRGAEREGRVSRWWRTLDKVSLACIFALLGAGLLLGSAASPPLAAKNGLPPFHYVERQAVFGCMAILVMLFLSALPPASIRRIGLVAFVATVSRLAPAPACIRHGFRQGCHTLVLAGFVSIQPSEFLKPAFVIVVSWMMAMSDEGPRIRGRTFSLCLAFSIAALLALQPDFGQASLVIAAWGAMFMASGESLFLVHDLLGTVSAAGVLSYGVSEHFARRINAYLSDEIDPNTQLAYVMEAIRDGGIFGVGIGEGEVKWRLPDAHTDFIIAVAAEEFGMLAVPAIMSLYLVVFMRGMLRAGRELDPFARIAAAGLSSLFCGKALINLGVAVKALPAEGMTLPLVSYGGSSLLAIGVALGFLLAVTRCGSKRTIHQALFRPHSSQETRAVAS